MKTFELETIGLEDGEAPVCESAAGGLNTDTINASVTNTGTINAGRLNALWQFLTGKRAVDLGREFFRYLLVGGTAFLVDIGTLYLLYNYVFLELGKSGVYLATALSFTCGLVYNYIFCLIFVFQSAKVQNKGKSVGAFVAFCLIGVIGLLLTELGMYLGIGLLAFNYLLVKTVVAGLVMLWNYGVRKLIIFS